MLLTECVGGGEGDARTAELCESGESDAQEGLVAVVFPLFMAIDWLRKRPRTLCDAVMRHLLRRVAVDDRHGYAWIDQLNLTSNVQLSEYPERDKYYGLAKTLRPALCDQHTEGRQRALLPRHR